MSSRFAVRLALPVAALTTLALSGSLALGTARREPCAAPTVKMTHIAGSDGAGQTAYRLTLRNTSQCTFSFDQNHANLILYKGLTRKTKVLPSHVVPEGKSHVFALGPGQAAHARLSFSPDVPGKNEPSSGPCEPAAHSVSVVLTRSMSGAPRISAHGPIVPPTSVCEHGRIQESALH